MDIFSIDRETYDNGVYINGIKTALWVEKYNAAGEFTITGEPTSKFRSDLKIGTLLSHVDSETIMIVETHEIDESKEGAPVLTVTGRDIAEVIMENRPIAFNGDDWDSFVDDFTLYFLDIDFTAPYHSTWVHVKALLEYFLERTVINPKVSMPNLQIRSDISISEIPLKSRVIPKLKLLSSVVRELLSSIDAGLKIERKNSEHPDHIEFVIHSGGHKHSSVIFDWYSGDLESVRYVWSHKDYKNAAYVSDDYFSVQIMPPVFNGLSLRILPVDASDWKTEPPPYDAPTVEFITATMKSRGYDELGLHKSPCIIDAILSKNMRFRYNVDYKIGDMIYVIGNYDCEEVMRVTEYAITYDETGTYGIPTISPLAPIHIME